MVKCTLYGFSILYIWLRDFLGIESGVNGPLTHWHRGLHLGTGKQEDNQSTVAEG